MLVTTEKQNNATWVADADFFNAGFIPSLKLYT